MSLRGTLDAVRARARAAGVQQEEVGVLQQPALLFCGLIPPPPASSTPARCAPFRLTANCDW